ncbi:hypothetical protein A2U01_0012301, partial [Trifolium medium]|nr:hypothetical protein [Trifolium medium]
SEQSFPDCGVWRRYVRPYYGVQLYPVIFSIPQPSLQPSRNYHVCGFCLPIDLGMLH